MGILAVPFGWLMKGCYLLVKNYGLALLIFTVITRLITLPLNIKQQRSTARMTALQPELEKLKQKYGKNQEKLNEETMRLYSENNVNPMASCLPALIPIILLYAMIPVVYKPLTYITDADNNNIDADSKFVQSLYSVSVDVDTDGQTLEKLLEGIAEDQQAEKIGELIASDTEKYKNANKALSALTAEEKDRVLTALAEYDGLDTFLSNGTYFTKNIMANHYGPQVLFFNFYNKEGGKYLGILHDDVQEEIRDFNYTAFGLDLGKIPSKADATVMIPIISCVLQLITTIISQIFQKRNNPAFKMQGSMLMMFLMMPLLSLWIGFKFPCALGVYWIYSSAFAVVQVFFLNIFYSPAKIKELAAKDAEKAKQKRKKNGPSFLERAIEIRNEQGPNAPTLKEAKKKYDDDEDDDGSDEDKKLTKAQQKERNRQKLNEARRRYAEKYGDEYTED